MKYLLKMFIARPGDVGWAEYRDKFGVGFFSPAYFAVTAILATAIIALLIICGLKKTNVRKQMKIAGLVFTATEILKMLYWGVNRSVFSITDVIPLFYCSLFIEALLCAGWGKGFIRKLGESFIMIGVVGGWLGLFVSEVFTARFPLFNYYTLLTLCYHSAMIYFGYAIYIGKVYKLDRYTFLYYAAFLTPFFVIAAILNAALGVNFMMILPTSAVYPALIKLGCIFGENLYTPVMLFFYYVGIFLISATPMTAANIISSRVRAKKNGGDKTVPYYKV